MRLLQHRSAEQKETGVPLGQLLMGRRLRTTMPTIASQLIPQLVERKRQRGSKGKQAEEYKRRHEMRSLPDLEPGTLVLVHEQINGE